MISKTEKGDNSVMDFQSWILGILPKVNQVIYTLNTICDLNIKEGGGVAQWLGRRISDQGVPGSNPGRCTFRGGLEQVTFTLLSTG